MAVVPSVDDRGRVTIERDDAGGRRPPQWGMITPVRDDTDPVERRQMLARIACELIRGALAAGRVLDWATYVETWTLPEPLPVEDGSRVGCKAYALPIAGECAGPPTDAATEE